jgi:hypothetical protein
MFYLFARQFFTSTDSMGNILQDGSKWRDTNASADKHGHRVIAPVLMGFAIRTIQVDLLDKAFHMNLFKGFK